MILSELLDFAISHQASDLHLCSNKKPALRTNGSILFTDFPPLTTTALKEMLNDLLGDKGFDFSKSYDHDFGCFVAGLGRFRVHWFRQLHGLAVTIRILAKEIPDISSLKFPPKLLELCHQTCGLILVTGATGAGKSTSLAAIINHINKEQTKHIISIEDPIEFVFTEQQSLISQREIGSHTENFEQGLRAALREDPDIIVIGELRDLASIRLALTAAETGHLVFATLHTSSAARTIHRIIDVFSPADKEFIRSLLANCLTAVLAQKLVLNDQGKRHAEFELMIANPAIRNLIRENKISQIYTAMQMGLAEGMCTFDSNSG